VKVENILLWEYLFYFRNTFWFGRRGLREILGRGLHAEEG
jgi:hypothetical protein